MKKVLFIDAVCPNPYDFKFFNNKPSGASELCLYLVAKLVQKYANTEIVIAQNNRKEKLTENKITYVGLEEIPNLQPKFDAIVVQRDAKYIPYLINKYPKAKIVLYQHDFFEGGALAQMPTEQLKLILDQKIPIITVSKWHKENIRVKLELRGLIVEPKAIRVIPHFIVTDIRNLKLTRYKNVKPDNNKICFFSSAHKGLEHTIQAFRYLHKINKDLVLYLANPSYHQYPDYMIDYVKTLQNDDGLPIIDLGGVPRKEILKHLQESLCVLSVNNIYPETFGLIHLEANAMGTPCVLLDYGANREVVFNPAKEIITPDKYMADPIGYQRIIKRVMEFHTKGKPVTHINPSYEVENVYPLWLNILGLYEI